LQSVEADITVKWLRPTFKAREIMRQGEFGNCWSLRVHPQA
jgi:hypothetical protein